MTTEELKEEMEKCEECKFCKLNNPKHPICNYHQGYQAGLNSLQNKSRKLCFEEGKQEAYKKVEKIYEDEDKKYGSNYGYWKMWREFRNKISKLKEKNGTA